MQSVGFEKHLHIIKVSVCYLYIFFTYLFCDASNGQIGSLGDSFSS